MTPDAPGESAQQRSAARMQRKEAAPKRSAEAKAPAAPAQQPKKEERFSLRTRERGSGPVTRSLQMSGAAPPAEAKSEDAQFQEPKETQVRRKHARLAGGVTSQVNVVPCVSLPAGPD